MNKEVKRESDESETKGNRSSRNEKLWELATSEKLEKETCFVKKSH